MPDTFNLITAEELKQRLDRGDDFKLVNALGEWEFKAKRIPGSLHFPTIRDAVERLQRNDDIIVYCSNPACLASQAMYRELEKHDFSNIRRFEGGLVAWEAAGYPLEGDWVA